MKKLILFLSMLLTSNSYCQHTDRFNNLVKELKPCNVETDTIYFSNGKDIYLIKNTISYEYNCEIFKTLTGDLIQYWKNGNLCQEIKFDLFGNYITFRSYNRQGYLVQEWVTSEIDTYAKSLDNFFREHKYNPLKRKINYFKYSKKDKERYKFKEDSIIVNGKEVIIKRTYFNTIGGIKKKKTIKK